jgi:hypothetical protein
VIYALFGPTAAGRPTFNVEALRALMTQTGFLGAETTHLSLSKVRLCFFASRMIVADEVKQRHKFTTLSFVEFLEALGRLTDAMNVPTDADLAQVRGGARLFRSSLRTPQQPGTNPTTK